MSHALGHMCRDCLAAPAEMPEERCPECGSPRVLSHPELHRLAIAHIDCDAFYAAIEKRDCPDLVDRPVIIGGGRRGVVAAACYVARVYGIRSAMPMFKALEVCPDAVVIRPDMAKYAAVGSQVRALMRAATPLVEPLSIDEAFLDLGGTELLHRRSPAGTLARLALDIERTIGIGVSIGLSYNKFLAKTASDLDKPRGFAVIGCAEARQFLAPRPIGTIYGVGRALEARLRRDGISTIGDLQTIDEATLIRRYGAVGHQLHRFARGRDDRKVSPVQRAKSVSSETTLVADSADSAVLSRAMWPLCEDVARRLKARDVLGQRVTLKLKTADFRLMTRSRTLARPTNLAEELFQAVQPLLAREAGGEAFRLVGVGAEELCAAERAPQPDLLAPEDRPDARLERAIDRVRRKAGKTAIMKGRSL
ncbi:MAG: DNA polymerase IV [Rhodospirillales bacterium]|nr:MAG: DNA polymerase IV [Rhodospirillales bacterium]